MSKARRIVLACYCLCVALAFVWVPWTGDVGYSWLWSRPQPRAIRNDLVADARQRWEAEYHANEIATVGEKWLRAVLQANPEDKDKDKVRKEAKRALEMAKLKRSEFVLSHRESMSDDEALNWLGQRDNFNGTFPEKSGLDNASRQKLITEWKQVVLPAKRWNQSIQYARMDYWRIGMELAALTALCALGFVLSARGGVRQGSGLT